MSDPAREAARAAALAAREELRALRERLGAPRPAPPADWGALRLRQRLVRVPAPAAAELGPLNTDALVPRVLQRLHALSPAYLQRLVTQLDALALLPAPEAPRSGRAARAGRR